VLALPCDVGDEQQVVEAIARTAEELGRIDSCFANAGVAQGDGGSLVATASLAARQGLPRGQAYGASKAGLIAIMNSIAVELGRYRIRAISVLPGWIETPMTDGLFAMERFSEVVQAHIPARRWGQPSDFEAVAAYLASPGSAYHETP
jgi:NAD(P)-dependent dehydrogenase (short-subunit alcohol dehydrogenase family)